MSFDAPLAFLLLIPVLALPLQARLTGRNRLAVGSMDDMAAGWTLRRALAWLPAALRIGGLVLLVVALARPRTTQHDVMVESDGLDIILALDTSGSMEARDLATSAMNANRLIRECMTGIAMRKKGITENHYLSPLTVSDGKD